MLSTVAKQQKWSLPSPSLCRNPPPAHCPSRSTLRTHIGITHLRDVTWESKVCNLPTHRDAPPAHRPPWSKNHPLFLLSHKQVANLHPLRLSGICLAFFASCKTQIKSHVLKPPQTVPHRALWLSVSKRQLYC